MGKRFSVTYECKGSRDDLHKALMEADFGVCPQTFSQGNHGKNEQGIYGFVDKTPNFAGGVVDHHIRSPIGCIYDFITPHIIIFIHKDSSRVNDLEEFIKNYNL